MTEFVELFRAFPFAVSILLAAIINYTMCQVGKLFK